MKLSNNKKALPLIGGGATKEAFRPGKLFGRREEREMAREERQERTSSDPQGKASKHLSKVSS